MEGEYERIFVVLSDNQVEHIGFPLALQYFTAEKFTVKFTNLHLLHKNGQ